MTVHNLSADTLVHTAEMNINAADDIMSEYAVYNGPAAQVQTQIAYAQGLYLSAQSYIALATFKQQERHA